MAHIRYFVVAGPGHWLVTTEGRSMAQVATQSEAVNSAIVMADLMGSMDHSADVMLAAGETLDLIWTYGVDSLNAPRARRKQAAV
jgi:hypothetical protein